ncbi:MAG: BTAD domain-containing putative transcriptional regulator [Gaiellaceae bacterium]
MPNTDQPGRIPAPEAGDLQPISLAERRARHTEPASSLASEVFELSPYGMFVTDGRGRLVASNRAGDELLGRRETRPGHASCCTIFGCRDRAPLEHACLTELATRTRKSLPEIRIDLEDAPAGAAWVTVAPLRPDGSRILFHLRAGNPGDRRRRTAPHWLSGPQLRIYTLGRTRVESGDGPLAGNWIQHRSGQLLKYLICERERMVHADEIAEALWPRGGAGALGNVRHFVHALREKLEPERERRAPSSFVLASRGGYSLDRERVWIDIDVFEEKVGAGLAALEHGDRELAESLLEEALDLYGGEFLADEPYSAWTFAERGRLRDLAGRALRALSDAAVEQGDVQRALAHAQRLGEMYPFDTDVQRELLALYVRLGRRSEAVRRYAELRMRLMSEFGERPEFSLDELTA